MQTSKRFFNIQFRFVQAFVFCAGAIEREKAILKKSKSTDRARYENSCYDNDDDDNIVFEDFARLRLNEPE